MAVSVFNVDVSNISKLADKPNAAGMDSETLKEEFDKAGNQIKTYLNGTLVSQINAQILEYDNSISSINSTLTSIQNAMLSFSQIYPIGSIYVSVNSTNPGTLFGGTWQRIEDTFLLASGSTYEAGTTGGSSEVTLTENQLPKISGTASGVGTWSSSASGKFTATKEGSGSFGGSSRDWTTLKFNFGNNEAHNNMPPYLAVYVWKRVS